MRFGNFWEFLDNVPGALEHLSTPQTPEIILTILPSVFFWENVGTTVSALILGALLGLAFWLVRQWIGKYSVSSPKINPRQAGAFAFKVLKRNG